MKTNVSNFVYKCYSYLKKNSQQTNKNKQGFYFIFLFLFFFFFFFCLKILNDIVGMTILLANNALNS